ERGAFGLGDAPPTRLAVNGNTIYAAFERRTAGAGGDFRGEVRVVREDNGGTLANRFRDLGDLGTTVVSNVILPGGSPGFPGTTLGHERIRSSLSVAVDPTNARKVFLAYTIVEGSVPHVHVDLSNDGGMNWENVYVVPDSSALPALAVANNRVVGLVYER